MARRRTLPGAYWRLWTASAVSNIGDGVHLAAFPLLGASLTRDPRMVAGLVTAQTLPWLVLVLFAGALVDRVDRRRLLAAVDAGRCVLLVMLTVAVAGDWATIWLCYLVAFLVGVGDTLFANGSLALLPSLVGAPDLERANGNLQAAEEVAHGFVGPPLGGALFAASAAVPFGVNGASFGLSAILVWSLRHRVVLQGSDAPSDRAAASPNRPSPSVLHDIAEGMRWLWHEPMLRTLAVLLGLWNLVGAATDGIIVLYAQDELGLGARGYGVLLAAGSIGAVVGGVATPGLTLRFGRAPVLRLALAGGAVQAAGMAVLDSAWLVGLVWSLGAFFGIAWNVITIAMRQTLIPDRLLGRVTSVYRLVGMGTMPFGGLAGGFVADRFGLRSVYAISAVIMGVVAVAAWGVLGRLTKAAAEPSTPVGSPGR